MGWLSRVSDSRMALIAVVIAHLLISVAHGEAHEGAHVMLSPAMAAFVYIVILAGPLVGLVVSFWRAETGAWIVAAAFAGSLIFGLVNHFIIAGADRIDHVAPEWRMLFGVTAALLLASEAAGAAIGVRSALRSARRTS
jgi:hypothetical protein